MFKSESSRILYIAASAYSTNSFFSLEEWHKAKVLVKNREELKRRNAENRRKTAINYGVA